MIRYRSAKRGAKPGIRGLRITVYDVLEYLGRLACPKRRSSEISPILPRRISGRASRFAADREREFVSTPPEGNCSSTRTSRDYRSRALWPSIPAPSTFETGLQAPDDDVVWTYAAEHGFVIAPKAADVHQRSFMLGHPPKVLEQRAWMRARLP